MEYRRMGESGLKVSEICLGTMTFGHSTDQDKATLMVDLAMDMGSKLLRHGEFLWWSIRSDSWQYTKRASMWCSSRHQVFQPNGQRTQ